MDIKDYGRIFGRKGSEQYVFEASDVDDAGATQYFGFINAEGGWVIQKYNTAASPKTLRYVGGQSDYSTAWTNRASLSYGYYNALFS